MAEVHREMNQASTALVLDLKRRGVLDDKLAIRSGEFGRATMGEVREKSSAGENTGVEA